MRYPKFLTVGDTIGFVAPAFGVAMPVYRMCYENGRKKLSSMGFGIEEGPNIFKEDGLGISTNPKDCGKELTDMYCSESNQGLISCGGGEMMCETIPFVDWDKIKLAEPKWFSGFSDNTNFVHMAVTKCDVASLYGPCAPSFGMEPWHPSIQDTMEVLMGQKSDLHSYELWEKESLRDEEHPYVPLNVTEKVEVVSFTGDSAFSGRLVGGCMDCLVNLLGTEHDATKDFLERYKEDGFIWVLEACDLNVWGIRRAIWQMKNAGWFQHVKGFLIGRPVCFGEESFGLTHYNAVTDLLAEYQVPILMDLDIGHMKPSMPIVMGATADVSFKGKDFTLTYTWK